MICLGAIAQLGERRAGSAKVVGSSPTSSTFANRKPGGARGDDRCAVRTRAVLRAASVRGARCLARGRGRSDRRVPSARRKHQRQPVAARHRQPTRIGHAREVVPRPGERHEPDRAARLQRQADRTQVRGGRQRSRGRRREGLECRLGAQPAHAPGRLGAEQGPEDRLPVGHARRPTRRTLHRRSAEDHRCSRPRQAGRPGGGDRRPAGSEGLQTLHRVERADRDHRRDGDPDARLRDDRLDAAADPQRDPRTAHVAGDHPPARSSSPRSRRWRRRWPR